MIENWKIYVDTSAFFALMDRSDKYHQQASILWSHLLDDNVALITSNYVVGETVDLLQKRIGFDAAYIWHRDILGILEVWWVNEEGHQKAYELWRNLGRKQLSLVDCVSIVTMHQHQIERAFCFKMNFTNYGFELLTRPSSNDK